MESVKIVSPFFFRAYHGSLRKDQKLFKEELSGNWIRTPSHPNGSSTDTITALIIDPNYIQLKPNLGKRKWTIEFEGNSIYFPEFWPYFEWVLFDHTPEELTIGIYDTINEQLDTLPFNKVL